MAGRRPLRRPTSQVLTAALLALTLVAVSPAPGQGLPPVSLETLATGLPALSSVTHAGDERLFLTTLEGQVLVWSGGEVQGNFLDLRSLVRSGGEQGLFSVAFHPAYPAVPFVFVNYTDHGGDTVVARYKSNGAVARPRTGRVLLHIGQPFANHNGGQLQFGPDGFLYIGMGDGGSGNDPECNAQRGDTLLGKMLRIDVDQFRRRGPMYGVPLSNPFFGTGEQRDEVWSIGLRNPWRFSFDRATGDLYIADVGQGAREEIDFQPASSGGGENYGWAREEGSLCIDEVGGCPVAVPACGSPSLVRPILEYGQESGRCAVIGGFVYRGSAIPGLEGAYLFGDFCSGTIWAAASGGAASNAVELGPVLAGLTSFGEDAAGELYAVSNHGVLVKLVPQ